MLHQDLNFERVFSRNTEIELNPDFIKKIIDLSRYNEIYVIQPKPSHHKEILNSALFKNFWTMVRAEELGNVNFMSRRPKLLICTDNIAPWPKEQIIETAKTSSALFDCLIFMNWPDLCGFQHSGEGVLTDREVLDEIFNLQCTLSKRCAFYFSDELTRKPNLRCIRRKHGRPAIIPFSLRTVELVKKLLTLIVSGLYGLRNLKTDLAYNRRLVRWKETFMNSFSRTELMVIDGYPPFKNRVHGSLQVGETSLYFLDPLARNRLKKVSNSIKKTWLDFGHWEDCLIVETQKNEKLFGQTPVNYDNIINKLDGLVIQAICFDSAEFLPNWVDHYRLLGVDAFLIYFNETKIPKTLASFVNRNEDVHLIPWPGTHKKMTLLGKPEYHTFQPASIQHAHALCSLSSASSMLSIDIDEYVIGPNLKDSMKQTLHDSMTFQNLWSSAPDYSASNWIGQSIKCDAHFNWDYVPRRKALWKLPANGKLGVHGEYANELRSREHVMLHFGNLKSQFVRQNLLNRGGLPEHSTYGNDFVSIKNHPNLEVRAIFEKWSQS